MNELPPQNESEPKKESREDVLNKYLERWREIRNEYVDDLPNESLPANHPDYHKMKYKTNIWQYVDQEVQIVLLTILDLTDETKNVFDSYMKYRRTIDFEKRRTAEEIKKFNEHLDAMIAAVGNELKKEN